MRRGSSRCTVLSVVAVEIGRPSETWAALVLWNRLKWPFQENGRDRVQWRVVVELSGTADAVQVFEVHAGGSATAGCMAATLGLTLADAKLVLAGLQRRLVQAQTEEHCEARRRCPRCGAQRPLKDRRARRLQSLFGAVEVRAPRFEPCRCSVTLRTIISPVTEIMPDRCTPEYERVLAKLEALVPYRRVRVLPGDLFPIGDPPVVKYHATTNNTGWRQAGA